MFTLVAKDAGWVISDGSREWEFDSLVAARAGLRTILKHGHHDQSTHGNHGGGGVGAGLSQSVQERVKANGGLSVNMLDGSEPTKGFMVAKGDGFGKIVSAEDFYDETKGRKILSDFVKEHKGSLGTGKSHLGIWHNQEDGKVYLDVSDNIMDRAEAIATGKKNNQISIWDVANFEEVQTGGTGEITKGKTDSGNRGSIKHRGDDGRADRPMDKRSVEQGSGAKVAVEFVRLV